MTKLTEKNMKNMKNMKYNLLLLLTAILVPIFSSLGDSISAKAWLCLYFSLGFLWLALFIFYLIKSDNKWLFVIFHLIVSGFCFLPYLPQAYMFSAWSIRGFAP